MLFKMTVAFSELHCIYKHTRAAVVGHCAPLAPLRVTVSMPGASPYNRKSFKTMNDL